MAEKVTKTYPDYAEVDVAGVYSRLKLPQVPGAGRPYVASNMVVSLDGKATLKGRSGTLADSVDRKLFKQLRTNFDAVMVGAGTVRTEGYGPIIRDEKAKAARAALGLEPEPLAVIVSSSFDLPPDLPLMDDPGSKVVVFTNSEQSHKYKAEVTVEKSSGDGVDVSEMIERLGRAYGVRTVLLEGGPRLNWDMLRADLADELFVTVAPMLVGGEGKPFAQGPGFENPPELDLVSSYTNGSYLYLRYRVNR